LRFAGLFHGLLLMSLCLLVSNCSSDEGSPDVLPPPSGIPEEREKRETAPSGEQKSPSSEALPRTGDALEGPDGDMDGDGIPNARDPNPLSYDKRGSSPSPSRASMESRTEGPDGDMDGDGIPNARDPNPLSHDKRGSSPSPSRARMESRTEGPDGDMDGDGIPNSKDPAPLEKQKK
tara:strand:+ start:529 stop:1059 length:531 start_codon:yes stop_codon:yes gene_type:complete